MEYKDENGKILYGYSQVDLNRMVRVLQVLAGIGIVFMCIVIYLLWWGHRFHIFTTVVSRCMC